jgi:hypothetical protein
MSFGKSGIQKNIYIFGTNTELKFFPFSDHHVQDLGHTLAPGQGHTALGPGHHPTLVGKV